MQKQVLDFDALEKELDAEFSGETAPVEEVTEDTKLDLDAVKLISIVKVKN